jgi:5'-methylthioinosine phosphorylase
MTAMPEASLARELGLAFASLCVVVNPAAGIGAEVIDLEDLQRASQQGAEQIMTLLQNLAL